MSQWIDALEGRRLFDGGELVQNFRSAGPGGQLSNQPISTINFKGTGSQAAEAKEVLADHGGRVYVAARVDDSLQVRRLTRTGLADGSFANGRGVALFPTSAKLFRKNNPGATDVALDSADRLYVLIGNRITRFTASGKLDASFGDRGNFTLTGMAGAKQIAIDPSNRIYLAGSILNKNGDTQFAVARLRSRGSYDPTFYSSGILPVVIDPTAGTGSVTRSATRGEFIEVINHTGQISIVAVGAVGYRAPDANIVTEQNLGVQVVRLDANGAVDSAFGKKGVYTKLGGDDGTTQSFVTPLAIQGDGKVYVRTLAYTPGTNTFSGGGISALSANGKTLSASTILETASPTSNPFAVRSFLTDDFAHEYVVGGNSQLIRLKRDSTLDTTFGSDSNAPYIIPIQRAAVDNSDGTLVTAYKASRALSLNIARYFANNEPIAQLSTRPFTQSATSLAFTVTYAAPGAVKADSVDGSEIRVINADGTQVIRARLISKEANTAGFVTARYRVADPDGVWDDTDNGLYSVRWIGGTVQSTAIVSNGTRTLGSLTVAIS